MAWVPDYLKAMAIYLQNPNVKGMYGMWNSPTPGLHSNGTITPGEGGVDLDAPRGTPIYALATGPIVAVGSWSGNPADPSGREHQVLTQRINVPGVGQEDMYYQHLYLNPGFQAGQVVQKGQQIGTVGSFGETEMGFNAKWGGIYGSNHPGPWVTDPRPWIAALMTGDAPPITSTGGPSASGSSSSGGADWATQFHNEGIKIGLFLVALVLVGFGLYLLFQKQADGLAKGVAKKAAMVALL